MRRERTLTLFIALLSSFPIFAFALSQKQPKANVASSVVWKAPAGQAADYAGADACIACHPVHADMFLKSAHADAAPSDAKYGTGCESCHGPGKAHIQAVEAAGGDDQKLQAAKQQIFGFRGKADEN